MSANRTLMTLVVLICLASWAIGSAVVARRAGLVDGKGADASGGDTPISGAPQPASADSLAKRCRERAARLARQLDQPGKIMIRPPFVLAGDLAEAEAQARFAATIRPACDALVAGYFRRLPDRPVVILMFKTEAAYRRAAEQLFFDRRVSRFGYYKPGPQTVLVNLAEGDSGLLHELTHVLMDADFPDAPRWLQEGLAALHEGSEVRTWSGHAAATACAEEPARGSADPTPRLVPHHNWRWSAVRLALAENRLPRLNDLITASTFRGPNEALDYACARYFCWFLHDRGRLQQLYVTLRERSASDPTGAATLPDVLGDPDWDAVDRDFRAWLETIASRPS